MKLLGFILLLTLPQWLVAQDIPDFLANYSVSFNSLQVGELKQSLSTNSDGSRVFKSESQAKGVFSFFKPDLVEETSVWRLQDNLILPQSYLYQRTGGKKEKFIHLNFDWKSNRLHIDDKKQPWTLELEQKTLDKLIYQLALMSDLTKDKTAFSYRVADGGKLKTYNIMLLEKEIITTPLGKVETVKLIRQREQKKERQTILWCAPALNYLPVKLEHTEKDGSVFTAVLRRLKGIDIANAFELSQQNKVSVITDTQ